MRTNVQRGVPVHELTIRTHVLTLPHNKALELTLVNVAVFRAVVMFRSRSQRGAGVAGCSSA